MSHNKINSALMGGLFAIMVVMGIAYAVFNTELNITGIGSTTQNWCIGFDSRNTNAYQGTAGITGGTVPTGSISFNGDGCATNYKTNASLNASFKQPGDKVEYTLTIGNGGSLNAAIESINVDGSSVISNTTITKGNIKFIIKMPETTNLAVNEETTMKVIAMFQDDTDVTSSSNEQQSISISINAVQDDGNGGFEINNTKVLYITGSSSNPVIGDTLSDLENYRRDLHCPIYNSGGVSSSCYSEIDDCLNFVERNSSFYTSCDATLSTLTEDYRKVYYWAGSHFIKYVLEDDVIQSTELCFIRSNNLYCLKTNDYDNSVSVLNEAFMGDCREENGDLYRCGDIMSFAASAKKDGSVYANTYVSNCRVNSDGTSSCS